MIELKDEIDVPHIRLQILIARRIATQVHATQKRWNGDPYISHPHRVSENVPDSAKPAAWLHDVIEDQSDKISIEDLRSAGISEVTIQAVEFLSKGDDECYLDYILRILRCPKKEVRDIVYAVKLADLNDNLGDLKHGSMRDKYMLTRYLIQSSVAGIEWSEWINRVWGDDGETYTSATPKK